MPAPRLVTAALILFGSLIAATPAHAAEPSGLDVVVRGSDPAKLVVVLTNRGAKPCQVVTGSALGTVAFTKVEQEGKAIQSVPLEVSFTEGMETILTQHLQTLEPGKSVELPLPLIKGPALEMATWSQSAGTFGALYPVTAGKAVKVELTYSVPVEGDGKIPICPNGTSSQTAAEAAVDDPPKWTVWALAAGGIALLLLVVIVVLLLRRKRRAATAAMLLLIAMLGFQGKAGPALATITVVDPSLQAGVDACLAMFHQPGHDPAGILPALEAPGVNVSVQTGDIYHEAALDGNTIFIFLDPGDTHEYFGGGGNADLCTALYHELHHGWQHNQGTYSMEPCATPDARGRTLPRTEVEATRAQNLLRALLGMNERGYYGDIPLPTGECQPPEQPESCTGPSCGDTNGDPHLLTFDGKRYDFQAVGEFVLSKETSGGYQVQVRQEPPATGSRLVSLNTAVAMAVGSDKVEVRMTAAGPALLIGGAAKPLANATLAAGEVKVVDKHVTVSWKDGGKVFVRPIGRWGLHIAVLPALSQAGKLEGLLGDYDGESKNDIKPKGGSPLAEPTFEALYPSYADSWRIDAKSSLFTYDAGTSTETYTDRKYPEKRVDLDSLPGRAAAEALCRRQGVTDPILLSGCILDVALTGQADFAAALARGQLFTGGPDFGGIPFLIRITKPNEKVTVQFDGTAGQQIFVDVPVSTLPNSCGVLDLIAPDGKQLKTGCIISGSGYIDPTTLPVTGKYTVQVEGRNGVGEARLRVLTIVDQVGPIVPDGPSITVKITKPGMVGRFTFTGKAGQRIYLDVTRSNMHSQCGILGLKGPAGAEIHSGCIVSGTGELDGFILPADGTYTIELDPNDRNVGDSVIRLIFAIDQHGTIELNGPAVIGKIQQPGAKAFFTFTGTAGQRIFVDGVTATLPGQCGILDLLGPNGSGVVSGCLVNGKGGIAEDNGYVLQATGTYTVVLDPNDNTTGEASLRLRS